MPSRYPLRVNIIIPLAGYTDALLAQLQSIVSQAYPFDKLICVTENEKDKAAPVISQLMRNDPRVIHVNAGRATSSSQKNHNLLAGLEHLTDDCDTLVFCDDGHIAPQNWLENLLTPFCEDTGVTVSSGYHHVFPASESLAIYCRAICVTTLHLLRSIPSISQPWGGATAVRLVDFKEMDVAKTWSLTIVDDVTLARLLRLHGKKLAVPVGADTKTYINSQSFSSMTSWLVRQIAYLKFVFPVSWVLLGIALFVLSFCLLSSVATLVTFVISSTSYPGLTYSTLYLSLFLIFSYRLRVYHPAPGATANWYLSCFLSCYLACLCHAKTWFTSNIHWGDTTYTVTNKGTVVDLMRNAVK